LRTSFADLADQHIPIVAQGSVVLDQFLDVLAGMQYRGVVAIAKDLAETVARH